MKKINKEVASRIYQARIANKLTQEQLAELSGISHDTISRIENGKTTDYVRLFKICKALGVKMVDLLKNY